MLKALSKSQAAREKWNLASIAPRLATAYVAAKQLYIKRFPNGPRPMMAEGWRDRKVQAHYYAQGRTTPGPIITYKKPGTSKHERTPAEAFDIALIGDDYEIDWTDRLYTDFSICLHEVDPGIVWGGSWLKFKDRPHFELK